MWLYIDQYGEKKRAKKQLVMEERNKQWERERRKGLFFCHIVVWSFYSKNKRKGWVFMTVSILGLYRLFDNLIKESLASL